MCSDHGDFAGASGLVEKSPGAADDMLTRVPLLIRTPGGVANQTIDTPINAFDATATLLDLANVTVNHTQYALSFAPALFGQAAQYHPYVFSEGGYTAGR